MSRPEPKGKKMNHNTSLKALTEQKIQKGVEAFKFYLSQGIDRATAREMVLSGSILTALPSALDAV